MTFRKALETSRNIPTIKLTQDVGVTRITNFVERLNLDIKIPQDLSVSLGSFGINLLNLVKMSSVFPNGGRKLKLKSIASIKDRYGKVHYIDDNKGTDSEDVEKVSVEVNPDDTNNEKIEISEEDKAKDEKEENPFLVNLDENQLYDVRLSYLMSSLLKGVVQNGTGRQTASISPFIGGKTGTTNNYVDAWFLGFSSNVVTGVWTGFDNNETLGFGETGAKSALPIWREVMRLALRKYGDVDFRIPEGIVNVAIDAKTGKLYQDGPDRFIEAFVEGTEPGAKSENPEEIKTSDDISILDSEDYYNAQ
jgi:penicillin-binding protein 1A